MKPSKPEIMQILNKCETELKNKIDQWNVKLANPPMDEASHDELKNLKDLMDETTEITKGIVQSASNKLDAEDSTSEAGDK